MPPPGLSTPREVKQYYDNIYDQLISSGQYVPFLYPWATVGFGIVLAYLLVDHRRSPTLQSLRIPLYVALCGFSMWCIVTNKARSPAASYGVGLCSAWGALWTGAIMCFNDCQTDFQRIERADETAVKKLAGMSNGHANGSAALQHKQTLQAADMAATQGPMTRKGQLFWQSYPSAPFAERLDWMVDVFCNFRGVGWNFQTYGIPDLPNHIQADLDRHETKLAKANEVTISRTGIKRFSDRNALLWYSFFRIVVGAIALDIIKLVMHHDAYFWGYMDASPPAWLPIKVQGSAILVQSYRLLVSLSGIYVALMEIFCLGPIFFAGILGPRWYGVRGEPWSNPPDSFGNFSAVLDKGVAGWWGAWWHQVFRYGFEAPATSLLQALDIDKKSELGKTISTLVAFFLSGCLHACGSYTQLGDTRPFRGPFLFFALQPVAILGQAAAGKWLHKAGITDKTPKILRQITNFVVVHVWLYHTAPLLVDDFAKGGVWLYEPLAISPLRILGFGAKDDNGWDLWYGLIFWRQGKHWWDTGVAF